MEELRFIHDITADWDIAIYLLTHLARGVFGAPSFVIGTDIFWGQDRLLFVEKALSSRPGKAPSA